MADPLSPDRIEIRAVQFVGTNVEMTYLVEAPEDEAGARLEALLGSKLGLYALTRTGLDDGRARFSVIASPLDRLFHKIGPSTALTTIKHASVTMELSETNLARQAQGLARTYSELDSDSDSEPTWRPWDVGKLLGTLLRKPEMMDHGSVRVAGFDVRKGAFPNAVLPILDAHVAQHGGVLVDLPPRLREAFAR